MNKIIVSMWLVLALGLSSVIGHDAAVRWITSEHVVMLTDDNGGGTGFFIEVNNTSYLLTNSHICRGNEEVNVSTGGTARVFGYDEDHDLCLLIPEVSHVGGIRLAQHWIKGEAIRVLGHGKLLPLHEQLGRVEASLDQWIMWFDTPPCPEGMREEMTWFGQGKCSKLFKSVLLLTATINPGNSGSPVLDKYGQAVGIVFAGGGGFGYAIPVEQIHGFLNELRLDSGLCVGI